MNADKNLIKEVQKRVGKNGIDKTILDYSPLRRLTYEDASNVLSEGKRYGGLGMNPKAMDLERKINKMLKKDKGDKKLDKHDLYKLVELIS